MLQRVAFFLPHFGHGGAEGVVLKLVQSMDRTRFFPLLILQHRRGEFLDQVPNDVPVIALRWPRPPRCIPDLAQILEREKIALVVTVTNATNLYAVPAAWLSRQDVATLITEHTPLSSFLQEVKFRQARRFAIRRIYPRATLAGGPLAEIGEDILKLLGRGAPAFVQLPNPVVDQVRMLRPLVGSARTIVSVGRLAPEKRFDLLIDAFALLLPYLPNARLSLYGEGAERPKLEAQIRRMGLKDRVTLEGFTSDLDAVHGKADLFVCTSRREGLGNAIIEAMARGVPVVSVDCPFGPRNLLRGNTAGRLVLIDDAPSIAQAMRETLESLTDRVRMTSTALDVAREYETGPAVLAYEKAFARAIGAR